MAKRINITISDSLYTHLQTVKDQVNVSALCVQGITAGLAEKGLLTASEEDIKVQKLRLKCQQKLEKLRTLQLELSELESELDAAIAESDN